MAAPWEKYQAASASSKPWEKYAEAEPKEKTEERPWYSVTPEGLGQATLNAIPAMGAIGGEVLGAVGGPLGMVAGGAAGSSAGQNLKDLIEERVLGRTPKTREQFYSGLVDAGKQGAAGSMVGQSIAPALNMVGKNLYNSTITPIEQEGLKYNKRDVGDVMYNGGISSPKNLSDKVQALVDQKMTARNDILSRATKAGAEVNTASAGAEAQAYINKLREINNPNQVNAINSMQADVDRLTATNAREAVSSQPEIRMSQLKPELMELPVNREQTPLEQSRMKTLFENKPAQAVYDAPTMKTIDRAGTKDPVYFYKDQAMKGTSNLRPVINDPVDSVYDLPVGGDYSEVRPANYEVAAHHPEVVLKEATPAIPRQAGPNPEQVSAWKTQTGNDIGQAGWRNEGRNFEKALYAGQRRAVGDSVESYLGPDERIMLDKYNADAGKLLSTGKGVVRVQNQADRLANSFKSPFPNGTEGAAGGLAAGLSQGGLDEKLSHGLTAMALQKGAKALQYSSMPVGYALRKASEKAPLFANPALMQYLLNKGDD